MNKTILILLILILGLLLSACGPETGDVVPIKFRHTQSSGSMCVLTQPLPAHASQNIPLALCLPRI